MCPPLSLRRLHRPLLAVALLVWPTAGRVAAAPAEEPAPPLPSSLEVGHPFIRNYTPREYQGYHTTFAVLQGEDGVIYVGSQNCVLEFDGETWRQIPVGTAASAVRGLAIQPGTGTIFVGTSNGLGYLATLPGGERRFVSLLDRLPPESRVFGETFRVYAAGDAVYFVTERQLMRWQHGQFTVWPTQSKDALSSACIGGHLYLLNAEQGGLCRLDGDTFTLVSRDPALARGGFRFMEPNPDGSFLLGTFSQGLFTLRDGVATPVSGPVNELLKQTSIRNGRRLRDGSLVIGTASQGVIVLDQALRFRDRWDAAAGLQNEIVVESFEDRQGGVWLTANVGVTRVEPSTVLTLFDKGNGFEPQVVWSAQRLSEGFTLTTEKGVPRLRPADPARAAVARFERIFTSGTCEGMCQVDDGLLVCGLGVNWLGADGRVVQVRPPEVTTDVILRSQRHPDRVFTGTKNQGLNVLRWNEEGKTWDEAGDIPEVVGRAHCLMEDPAGGLWLGTWNHGLIYVRPAEGPNGEPRAAEFVSYFQRPGPLQGQKQVTVRQGAHQEILAMSQNGLYRFDPTVANFVPAEYAGFPAGSAGLDNFYPADDGEGTWLASPSGGGPTLPSGPPGWAPRVRPGETRAFRPLPAKIADRIGRITDIFPDRDGIAWITGTEGMARLESRRWLAAPAPAPARTLLRKAFSTLGLNHEDQPQAMLGEELPHERNSVHFEFAATTFEAGPRPGYQVRLVGLGAGQWSEFHGRPNADFTNLPEGSYTFEVRARDADGRTGDTSARAFRILPPWQRMPWAYPLYGLTVLVAVYGLVGWRNRHLQRRNAALEATVAVRTGELRARETDLVRARDAAEGANRAKSAFLANMSHELRTPLNAILGYSQILLGDATLPARSREQLAVIDQSGEHLLSLINEVLDLAKVEAGQLTLNASDFPLDPLLDEVGAAFRPRLAEKGLAFQDARHPGLPPGLHADRNRLRQVLFNLLGNAVKFTRRGNVRLEVGLAGEAGAPAIRFVVADTGVGIADGELATIFEAFRQGSDRRAADQGTGLGLAISQELTRLLGGVIRVESTPGQGSRFWFDLPLVPAALPSSPAPGGADEADAVITGYLGATRRLLVVDDLAENRRVLRDLLAPLGFAITEADDGAACLEECARARPDAVLLDLRMEPPDGFEVARRLRRGAVAGGPPPVIVALSASVFESDRQQALDAGCDEFLPKPFRTHQVLSVLGRLLALRWVYAEASPPARPADQPGAEGGALSGAELAGLREFSDRGDVMGIRKQLEAWLADGTRPGRAAVARGLLPLVISYRVDELHARLMALSPTP